MPQTTVHLVLLLLSFLSTAVHSYQYELLRRRTTTINGTVYAGWEGSDSGTIVFTNCTDNQQCGDTAICNNRTCICNATFYTLSALSREQGKERLTDQEKSICGYEQISKVFAIVVSVVFGGCGVDRCLLARGDASGICIGITKGVTIGACKLCKPFLFVTAGLDLLSCVLENTAALTIIKY